MSWFGGRPKGGSMSSSFARYYGGRGGGRFSRSMRSWPRSTRTSPCFRPNAIHPIRRQNSWRPAGWSWRSGSDTWPGLYRPQRRSMNSGTSDGGPSAMARHRLVRISRRQDAARPPWPSSSTTSIKTTPRAWPLRASWRSSRLWRRRSTPGRTAGSATAGRPVTPWLRKWTLASQASEVSGSPWSRQRACCGAATWSFSSARTAQEPPEAGPPATMGGPLHGPQ